MKSFARDTLRSKPIPGKTPFCPSGVMIDNRVFVSCDTKFDPELIDYYSYAERMFHDVQFFPGAVHAPLQDLRGIPPEVKVKMDLIHYADSWRDQDVNGFAGWAEQGVIYSF